MFRFIAYLVKRGLTKGSIKQYRKVHVSFFGRVKKLCLVSLTIQLSHDQNLQSFVPWQLIGAPAEFDSVATAFENEDIKNRKVFVFASRQDNDDFAGLEIVNGIITDKVLYFHPVFSSGVSDSEWDIVDSAFEDVFEFMSKQIIPDMKDWAITEDASELKVKINCSIGEYGMNRE